jgi:hypothetical protein
MPTTLTAGYTFTRGDVSFRYGGGRLADITMGGKFVDCLQAVPYDWQKGAPQPSTTAKFRARCEEWLRDHEGEYRRELPYL